VQADRLAAMGSYVSGIAHVIKANSHFLARELAESGRVPADAKEALAEIRTRIGPIRSIVDGLERFSWAGTTSEQCARWLWPSTR
jgi:C4-dicarboxylate-specific signal transduction histidine kinase